MPKTSWPDSSPQDPPSKTDTNLPTTKREPIWGRECTQKHELTRECELAPKHEPVQERSPLWGREFLLWIIMGCATCLLLILSCWIGNIIHFSTSTDQSSGQSINQSTSQAPGQSTDSSTNQSVDQFTDSSTNLTISGAIDSPTDTPTAPAFIDLQPTLEQWLQLAQTTKSSQNAQIGVMIYDLDHNQIAAAHNAEQIFSVASLYKLFFVYPLARALSRGELDGDTIIATTTDYRAGTHTLSACLDLMLRESYNGCADPLRNNTTYAILARNFLSELSLKNTSSLGLYSTAADLNQLLISYYDHLELTAELWEQLADAMLNQPVTTVSPELTYNWRQGLPSGFSNQALVYNKVGWEWTGTTWDTYADAAIVEFPALDRHYTMVVLTSGITDAKTTILTKLGQMLEAQISS